MADYTKTTNFTAKDALSSGDPDKVIVGAEHDVEFDAIAVAIATKADDNAVPHLTGTETIAGNKTFSGNNTHSGTQLISGVTTMSAKPIWLAEGANVASATDCNIWSAADGNTVHITGTTTISDWGTAPQAGARMWVIFDGALQLTYDATTNKLNTNATNYTTVAGDRAEVYAETTSSYVVTIYPIDGSTVAQIVTADITDANVTQAKLANSSVGQAQLKTATQQTTGFAGGGGVNISFTGGAYTLGWGLQGGGDDSTAAVAAGNGAAYAYAIFLSPGGSPGVAYYFQASYITASPPYDLGDGDVPLFVYAEVTPSAQIVRVDVAQDPPWIYNGPNRINPHKIRYGSNGRNYYREREIIATHGSISAAIRAGVPRQVAINRLGTDQMVEVEITRAFKNRDMNVIPSPFSRKQDPSNVIVMLDPVSPLMERLLGVHEAGDPDMTVSGLLRQDYIRIGNTSLPRVTPSGVIAVNASWRPGA